MPAKGDTSAITEQRSECRSVGLHLFPQQRDEWALQAHFIHKRLLKN